MNGQTSLYETVANKIESLIAQGVLLPGEKAPSVRKIRKDQGVSLSTAFQAYYIWSGKASSSQDPGPVFMCER